MARSCPAIASPTSFIGWCTLSSRSNPSGNPASASSFLPPAGSKAGGLVATAQAMVPGMQAESITMSGSMSPPGMTVLASALRSTAIMKALRTRWSVIALLSDRPMASSVT